MLLYTPFHVTAFANTVLQSNRLFFFDILSGGMKHLPTHSHFV